MGCGKSTAQIGQEPKKVIKKNKQQQKINSQNNIDSTTTIQKSTRRPLEFQEDGKVCKPCVTSDLQQYVLLEPELDIDQQDKIYKLVFKINEFDDKFNIFCGIAHQDTLQMTQYFKKRWFDEIDHGLYAIDDFGHCFSNVDEKVNNQKMVGWGFSRSQGCIIQISVDPLKKKIKFQKIYEQKEYKAFELDFDTKQIRDEGNFSFFVCFGGNSQIEIIENFWQDQN